MLTLLIPTKDRSSFLSRLLFYYKERGLTYRLLIADSSRPEHLSQNQRTVDSFKTNLDIEYKTYDPEIEFARKLDDALKYVDTPYVVLGADDDFFIPRTFERAVEFLEEHLDYSIAHGDVATFVVESESPYGPIFRVSRCNQIAIERETASQRFYDYLVGYSASWYSVQRTEQFRKNWQKTIGLGWDLYFSELLPSCLSLIQGKAKRFEGLYLLRQIHSLKEYTLLSAFDWITTPDWVDHYERFRDCLVEELTRHDDLKTEKARSIVKQAFWSYVTGFLSMQWQDCYRNHRPVGREDRIVDSLRETLRLVPGLQKIWRMFRSVVLRSSEPEISLPALLKESSPYYEDFQPIYCAVTETPRELPNESPHLDKSRH